MSDSTFAPHSYGSSALEADATIDNEGRQRWLDTERAARTWLDQRHQKELDERDQRHQDELVALHAHIVALNEASTVQHEKLIAERAAFSEQFDIQDRERTTVVEELIAELSAKGRKHVDAAKQHAAELVARDETIERLRAELRTKISDSDDALLAHQGELQRVEERVAQAMGDVRQLQADFDTEIARRDQEIARLQSQARGGSSASQIGPDSSVA
jgi:predicted  nucleic acid-binding Zn-ribbon protein